MVLSHTVGAHMYVCVLHTSLGIQQPISKAGFRPLWEMWFSIAAQHGASGGTRRRSDAPSTTATEYISLPVSRLFCMCGSACSTTFRSTGGSGEGRSASTARAVKIRDATSAFPRVTAWRLKYHRGRRTYATHWLPQRRFSLFPWPPLGSAPRRGGRWWGKQA